MSPLVYKASKPKKLLALDPGESVGWASVQLIEGALWEDCEWNHGILPLREAAIQAAKAAPGYDLIIYETWRLSERAAQTLVGSDIPSIQFVGMVRLAAWMGGTKVHPQDPGKMKTARTVLPPFLQTIVANEPKRHDDAHNVSALLHLWYFIWRTYVTAEAR